MKAITALGQQFDQNGHPVGHEKANIIQIFPHEQIVMGTVNMLYFGFFK